MGLSLRSLAIVALCLATTPLRAADPQDPITPRQKIQLFNGKDLTGWYTWTRDSKYEDPKKVFSVVNGHFASRGEEWGGVATKKHVPRLPLDRGVEMGRTHAGRAQDQGPR